MSATLYTYRAEIVHWIDGDTVDVDLDLGFGIHLMQRVRIAGVDTPETRTLDLREKARGLAALSFVENLAPYGTRLVARTHKLAGDKFGRFLADLILDDGRSVAAELLAAGHAVKYDGGAR